jgi:nucleoside-diphosphate-sugar epimerase
VIGHSRDGRYGGKPYGLYQLWSAFPRFLEGLFPDVLHVVAGEAPINFLHQDSFVAGFWQAYQKLPDGSVFHLVSGDERLPSMRELWKLWVRKTGGPQELHFYSRLVDVPMDRVDERLRMFLEFTTVNSEIASVHWQFETNRLGQMLGEGLEFAHASLETVAVSQERFFADSDKVQRFVREWRARGSSRTRFIAHE